MNAGTACDFWSQEQNVHSVTWAEKQLTFVLPVDRMVTFVGQR